MALNGLFVAKTIEASLDAPLPLVLSLNSFSTDFSAEAAASASITTRFAGAGTIVDVNANGYAGNAGNTTAVTINLSNNHAAVYSFSELNVGQTLTPETLANLFVVPAINAIAQDIVSGVFGICTSGNFSNGIVVPNATGFSLATLNSGNAVLDTVYSPLDNRFAIFNPAYKQALLNNTNYTQAYSYGSNEAISKGLLPSVYGINPLLYNGTIASSDGNLQGAIFHKNAFAIAARTPAYEASQGYGFVENFVEPNTKLPLQMRMWNDMNGNWKLSVGTVWGVAKGTAQAVRITNS